MSSNAKSYSQVLEEVEKPHYSLATVCAANSAEKAINHLFLAQIALWDGGKKLR